MNATPQETPLTKTLCAIGAELLSANEKYQPQFRSNHEALGVIMEEYEEYKDEVKACKGEMPTQRMIEELKQLAAMCVKEILRGTGEEIDPVAFQVDDAKVDRLANQNFEYAGAITGVDK